MLVKAMNATNITVLNISDTLRTTIPEQLVLFVGNSRKPYSINVWRPYKIHTAEVYILCETN